MRFDWRSFITPAVKILVLTCAGVFLFQTLFGMFFGERAEYQQITLRFGLVPSAVILGLRIWQPITYIFLHGGLWHLLINMLMLWMFGRELEGPGPPGKLARKAEPAALAVTSVYSV